MTYYYIYSVTFIWLCMFWKALFFREGLYLQQNWERDAELWSYTPYCHRCITSQLSTPLTKVAEKAMATHSSTLAWKIPWTEEPGGLQSVGSLSQTRLSDFTFSFHFHALEKEMATHSSVLAWRIPGAGEPGGLPSMGLHRVGHDCSDLAAAAAPKWCTCYNRWIFIDVS